MKTIGFIFVIIFLWGGTVFGAELTAEQWMQYSAEVETMFQERAEQVARGEAQPIKCATPILLDLMQSRPADVFYKPAFTDREDTMSFTYDSDHFRLHFTNNGNNAIYQFVTQTIEPGVPDYIVIAARILDSVWNHTVGDLNFPAPLSDGYYNGGGNGLFDVYFINVGAYGATVRDSIQATLPITATAYMFLENDYEGFQGYEDNRYDALRVSAAHEFSHAVHFALDIQEVEVLHDDPSPAWMEMSATFMEEEHYPEINDYFNYLQFFYKVPSWSLRTGTFSQGNDVDPVEGRLNFWRNLHMYGSVVFPIYLRQRFGGAGIIRDIWIGCGEQAGANWISAADDAVRSNSNNTMDLQDAFQEFTLWNFFTKTRNRAGYYPDGAQINAVSIWDSISSYPATVTVSDSAQPDNFGANYIILKNIPADTLDILFTPDDSQPWGITIVKYQNDIGAPVSIIYVKNDTLIGPIRISDAGLYDRIALIPAVLGGNMLKVDYTLNISPGGEGILRPTDGEVLYGGTTYQIQWFIESITGQKLIELSLDGGSTWSQVAITSNPQAYDWIVPEVSSEECQIRISDYPAMTDSVVSDGMFSIRSIRVLDPFPNPAWPDVHDAIFFKAKGSSQAITVAITTISGELVRELSETSEGVETTIEGDIIVPWDFTNESGEEVASGPYIAVIRFEGDDPVLKKFVVLR